MFLKARSPNRYHIMRILRQKGQRHYAEILSTLLANATHSGTASVTLSQLTAAADTTANVQGGVRTIAAEELIGLTINSDKDDASANTARAVTAADVTAIQEEILTGDDAAGAGDRILRAPSDGSGVILYAADASGNGGGGKQDAGR